MNNLFIPVILGTGREGRITEKAARFVYETLRDKNICETLLVDVRDYAFNKTDDDETSDISRRYIGILEKADGVVIVLPEYNHGYPGELKLLLDCAYDQYAKKPIALCGVSRGGLGGARVVEQLRLVAIELQMVPIRNAVYFSFVHDLFDEKGTIKDPSYALRLQTMFDELLWYAHALKMAREEKRS